MENLRFVDLFAGVGGFHIALKEEFDAECVFASDIDGDCRSVYATNFGVMPFGDIRSLSDEDVATIPDHDLLCAGFPCQPFSKSGLQLGIAETRGTLFYDILRILDRKRPRWVMLENVRNIAGPKHTRTLATIVRQLRSLGYRVASQPTIFSPHLLPLELGGRPQYRERAFILAEFVGTSHPDALFGKRLVENGPVEGWSPSDWRVEQFLVDDESIDTSNYVLRPNERLWIEAWNDFSESTADTPLPGFPLWERDMITSPRVDRWTPAWKATYLRKNSEFYLRHMRVIDSWRARHPELADFPLSRTKFEWQAQKGSRTLWDQVIQLRPSGIRVRQATYLPALVAITQTSIIGPRQRHITPREAARLQGFPESFRLHPNDSVAYRQLGNAVSVGVVRYLARNLLTVASDRVSVQSSLQFASTA